jgi:hypothetical protein
MGKDDLRRYQDNLREELDGAALYADIAAAESDPVRKQQFLQLAEEEARHAAARSISPAVWPALRDADARRR